MLTRYTTPYHHFVLPFLTNEIDKVTVTYVQNGEELVCKNKDDVTIHDIQEILDNASMGEDILNFLMSKVDVADESCLLSLRLTQEETSSFTFHKAEEKNIALVQIRVLNTKGDAFVSRPIRIRVYGSINEGVI